jgi:hypothetical protein
VQQGAEAPIDVRHVPVRLRLRHVLRSAADRAREEMRDVVRALKSYPPEKEYSELFRWCTTNMKVVADEVVRAYVDHPDVIDKLIEDAKHD